MLIQIYTEFRDFDVAPEAPAIFVGQRYRGIPTLLVSFRRPPLLFKWDLGVIEPPYEPAVPEDWGRLFSTLNVDCFLWEVPDNLLALPIKATTLTEGLPGTGDSVIRLSLFRPDFVFSTVATATRLTLGD
jgi:hypothetical protein